MTSRLFNVQLFAILSAFCHETLAISATGAEPREFHVCNNELVFVGTKIDLTETEMVLICNDVGPKAWRDIPPAQQQYFIKRFLEARGYYDSKITHSKQVTRVDVGDITLVSQVKISGSPVAISARKYWRIIGRPLTSDVLDELSRQISTQLSMQGYPCAVLDIVAKPIRGDVHVTVKDAKLQYITEIDSPKIKDTIGGVERRYDAFEMGGVYDSLLLDLSAQRMMADDLVVSTTYLTECNEQRDVKRIRQLITAGEPRLLTFGIGFDTEEYFIGEAGWRNTRMTAMASSFEAYARASYRKQRARIGFDWYYAPIVVRHYLRSILSFLRENEPTYDSRELKAKVGPAWNFDVGFLGGSLWVGPAFSHTEVVRGVGPATSEVLAFEMTLRAATHRYEFFAQDPRTGFEQELSISVTRKAMASDYSATRYQWNTTMLHNLLDFDPPIWVLGLRASLATVVIPNDTEPEEIPANNRLRLGGSGNLRGFPRDRVPEDGALTSAYIGGELRLNNVIPFNIRPIIFLDWGRFGDKELYLDDSSLWSPGLGVDWKSPIGTIRATAAHAFVSGDHSESLKHLERWHFYLSYGEQF